ncbi:hypothetical protein CEXT_141481, partial [Caerostris extrusa]
MFPFALQVVVQGAGIAGAAGGAAGLSGSL